MHILKIAFIILEVLLLFNLLIFVHELGHFLAARWRGLKIDRFAIWFGKPIWQKKINGITYALGTIPAGGYVALPQMAPMETIEGKGETREEPLPPISPLDKIIVAFAGPLFSLGLALTFGVLVWIIGRPVSESETTNIIGYVQKGGPADDAKLLPGDKIIAVDNKPVSRFGGFGDGIRWRIISSETNTFPITYVRTEAANSLPVTNSALVTPTREKTGRFERSAFKEIQVEPKQTAIIAGLDPELPAAKAGLKVNDIIDTANGQKIYHFANFVELIRKNPEKPVTLGIVRGKERFEITLATVMKPDPESKTGELIPRIGITKWESGGLMDTDNPNPFLQVNASIRAMGNTLGALISRKSDVSLQHMNGPAGIVRIYYRLFESEQGWRLAIWFSVILNVNLALLNLLPIPVLDGGHITLAMIEAIRRKPANVKLLNILQTSCAIVIICYILFVSFYDVQDWFPGRSPQKSQIKATPQGSERPAPKP